MMSTAIEDVNLDVEFRKVSLISSRELSLRGLKLQKSKDDSAPPDKYHLVHVIFFFLGVGSVVPPSFFLVAQDYWMYKFRDKDYDYVDLTNKTTLQKNFVSIAGLSHTFPAILTTLLSSYYGHKINIHSRLVGCMSSLFLTYVVFTAFIKIDTDPWQLEFFILTIVVSTAITVTCRLYEVTIFPLISRFPQTYMKSNMYGAAATGLFSAVLQIFCLRIADSSTTVALIYFLCGTSILGVCTLCAVMCRYVPRFSYYLGDTTADTTRPTIKLTEVKDLAMKLWPKIVLSLTALATAGMSGNNITTLVVSEHYSEGGEWATKYFEPVVTFLWPDILSLLARYFARPLMTRKNAPYFVLLDCLRILALNPLFLFCNAQPRKHVPVLLPHDWQYVLVISAHAFIANFFGMSAFMSMENLVPGQAEQGFMFMACFGGVMSIPASTLATLWVNVL